MNVNAYKEFHRFTTDAIVSLSWDPIGRTHIPFRASLRHEHSTWARTNHSRPELYIQPQSIEELRLVVELARRCRKQIVVVGSGHSPSDITCTSSWMINLDNFCAVVSENPEKLLIVVQAGIRLYRFISELDKRGWAMPNLGSITEQSIAGAIATSTHGSSLRHGLISESVVSLTIMLSNGKLVECSRDKNEDLFKAGLVSLGGLGIIVHVGFQAVPDFKVRWEQEVVALPKILKSWDDIWHQSEFVRCWWFPYSARTILWAGDKSKDDVLREPPKSWYGASFGRWSYELLLYVASWLPKITPKVEQYVFSMQYGWDEGAKGSAVQPSYEALTMDCLFPQLVNEWAIPLENGPEVITRLEHWLCGRAELSGIPFDPTGIYVHAPIEIRVSDSSTERSQNPWLDQGVPDGPTLYMNATLYRPFLKNVPHWERYYQAFEYVMKEMGGKPHWAKNFVSTSREELWEMYPDLGRWVKLRNQIDPEEVFVTEWLRRNIVGGPEAEKAVSELPDFELEY